MGCLAGRLRPARPAANAIPIARSVAAQEPPWEPARPRISKDNFQVNQTLSAGAVEHKGSFQDTRKSQGRAEISCTHRTSDC